MANKIVPLCEHCNTWAFCLLQDWRKSWPERGHVILVRVSMLRPIRIDKMALSSVFRVPVKTTYFLRSLRPRGGLCLSVKATHFAMLSEILPLFTVLLILHITLNNECFFPPFLQNLHLSTLNDDFALKNVPFLFVVFFLLLFPPFVQASVLNRIAEAPYPNLRLWSFPPHY